MPLAKSIILLMYNDQDQYRVFEKAVGETDDSCDLIAANSCDNILDVVKYAQPTYVSLDEDRPKVNGFTCLNFLKASNLLTGVPNHIVHQSYTRDIHLFVPLLYKYKGTKPH